ncbi:putative transcription factor GRF family [Medicago truncatula]|uniref:GRF zinc finger protein n=1 Tax=Medicago truncatula TaxID=3880 RepID=A0A072VL81_MEDTR|nr:GRF zinc finger protein [Medicago truncatula]RHN80101.1 putative transcription factor GRF family [Medicago truncatula]
MGGPSSLASTVSGSSCLGKTKLVCYCGVDSPLVTAWADENSGRRFHGCGKYWQRRKCSFFRWFDPEVPDRQKKLIRGLLKKNDALKNKEKMLLLTIVILGMLLFVSVLVILIKLG